MPKLGTWAAVPLSAAALLTPATASAVITPMHSDADAVTLAKSIAADPSVIDTTTTKFSAIAPDDPDSTTDVPAALSTSPLTGFPLEGSPDYAILASGDASHADQPNDDTGYGQALGYTVDNRGPKTFDPVTLNVGVNVPAGINCLAVRFRFLSEEYPEYVNSDFNDAFIAELDTSDWATTDVDSAIVAPHNFAFDQTGKPITVNDAGASTVNADNAIGTTYDGATRRLAAVTQVTPGAHTLYLSIFDRGDSILDSAVFVDNLQLLNVDPSKCSGAAFFDDAPPAVTTGGVTAAEPLVTEGQFSKDDTPTFVGKGGTTINDEPNITGAIYSGTQTRKGRIAGTPVQSKTVPVANDGSWTITADPLPEGSYTFQATQGSKNGATASPPLHFTIDKTGPAVAIADTGFYSGKTRDLTPLLSGTGGANTAGGDGSAVSVTLFSGKAAAGAPLQTIPANLTNGAWAAQLLAVKAGTYTAAVTQGDQAGNTTTTTKTFTVTTSNPIGKVKLKKKLSRAAAAKGLKGSLKFAFPGKVGYALSAKIGKKTKKVGSVSKTLKAPGKAAFKFKTGKKVAGASQLILKTTFKDDQGRKYSRTQKVKVG